MLRCFVKGEELAFRKRKSQVYGLYYEMLPIIGFGYMLVFCNVHLHITFPLKSAYYDTICTTLKNVCIVKEYILTSEIIREEGF